MTMLPEEIYVICKCGHEYEDSYRPSINTHIDPSWTPERIDAATSAICPKCGHKIYIASLIVRDANRFEYPGESEGGDATRVFFSDLERRVYQRKKSPAGES